MRPQAFAFQCRRCGEAVLLPPVGQEAPVRCGYCAHHYDWDQGILWLGAPNDDEQPSEYYSLLVQAEPRHFWFGMRNRIILATLREVIGPLAGHSVLDIGCGTGFVLAALERAGMHACGLDMLPKGLGYARRRVVGPLVATSAPPLPFRDQFDVAMLCDVVEHVADDVGVLREAGRTLHAEGALVVTVPAFPALWTPLDDLSGHKRRYTRRSLVEAMERAGLRVVHARYFGSLLFPPQFLARQRIKSLPVATASQRERLVREALAVPPRPLNALLGLTLAADMLLRRLPIPFGTALIAVGRPA
jgi:SAM-dependent methyltransferase